MGASGATIAAVLTAALALITSYMNRRPTKVQEADSAFTRMEKLVERLEKDISDRSSQVDNLQDKLIEAEAEIERLRSVVRDTTRSMMNMQHRMERMEIVIGRAAEKLRERGIDTKDFEV